MHAFLFERGYQAGLARRAFRKLLKAAALRDERRPGEVAGMPGDVRHKRRLGRGQGHISPQRFLVYVRVLDAALLVAAGELAWFLSHLGPSNNVIDAFVGAIAGSWITVACLGRAGNYSLPRLRSFSGQFGPVLWSVLPGAAVLALLSILTQGPSAGSWHPGPVWAVTASASLLLVRGLWVVLVHRWIAAGRLRYRIGIVGATTLGMRFATSLTESSDGYNQLVGLYDSPLPDCDYQRAPIEVAGTLADLLDYSRGVGLDAIVIALPLTPAKHISRVLDHLRSVVVDIYVLPDIPYVEHPDKLFTIVEGYPVIPIVRCALDQWQVLQKALFDRLAGLSLLVFAAPLLLLIAALVKLDSPGPVLFRQSRVGFNNRPFTLLKFRSLYHHLADLDASTQTLRGDARVTRVGRWLRKLSLDELPQLINVVQGEMSLVGPRPHALNTSVDGRRLAELLPDYPVRHRVKPGITGWAQVNGARGALNAVEQVQKRITYDLEYIRNWSLLLDIKILAMTFLREIISDRAF